MSHFTLMVIGPETKEEIDAALAPFDENMEVEPYRSYEKGDAEDRRSPDSSTSAPSPW